MNVIRAIVETLLISESHINTHTLTHTLTLSHTNENTCQIRSLTSRLTRREFCRGRGGETQSATSHTHTHTAATPGFTGCACSYTPDVPKAKYTPSCLREALLSERTVGFYSDDKACFELFLHTAPIGVLAFKSAVNAGRTASMKTTEMSTSGRLAGFLGWLLE